MFDSLEIFRMAQGMARHASSRQSLVARNIAHVDTPGYKQQDIKSFAESYRTESGGFAPRRTRATHFSAPASEYAATALAARTTAPNGNDVSLENEILKAAEVRQQHDMALSIYRNGLGVIRASLGKR